MSNLYLPDLTGFDPDIIFKLYTKKKAFRDKICKITEKIFTEFQQTSSDEIGSLARKVQDGVWKFISEVSGKKIFSFTKNIGYTISSIFIPLLAGLPVADEFITWLSSKRKYGYIFFLSELKALSNKEIEDGR